MAALYEGFTLCGLVLAQNVPESGIQGIELAGDDDHVIVTDSARSITVYKVSDQKPLGSWTVKQEQTLTCPTIRNSQTGEYVAVTDNKVIRVWKEEDLNLEKAFKATVSADVWRIHSTPASEPMVLFKGGGVRLLDGLLMAPQQPIEEVLSEEEVIRWSTGIVAETQHSVLFITEQGGEHFLYVQRLNPNTLLKYKLDSEEGGGPLSFSASVRDKHVNLLCLYPNGCLYQSVVAVRGAVVDGVQSLPRTLLFRLAVGEGRLASAAAVSLDEAHVAVVGVPHPSAGARKDFLCIWNTNFQTLQAGKEMSGRIYGQLWCFSGKLLVSHGKALSVVPYECQKSSLAAALGKLKHSVPKESKSRIPLTSWNAHLHGDKSQESSRSMETRKNKLSRKSQSALPLTTEQVLEQIKTAPEPHVQKEVEDFLHRATDLQHSAGPLACQLVARSQAEPAFYIHSALVQLVQTQCVCHSVCPDLLMLALEKKDYFLCQLCLQLFPDVPEAVTCACLKTFISLSYADVGAVSLEPSSVAFMEGVMAGPRREMLQQNGGFSPPPFENEHCKVQRGVKNPEDKLNSEFKLPCPVGLNRAVLLNEILQTPYSDNFLLPHLKDLTSQQVLLFLRYLHFLYLKYSQEVDMERAGLRSPTMTQVMDWVCVTLDAHFTVLVLVPEAKDLLLSLHRFVTAQVRLYSEMGKIRSSLQELHTMKQSREIGQYSIEIIELF